MLRSIIESLPFRHEREEFERRLPLFAYLFVVAALLVGWFAWQQRRLTRVLQGSLEESNRLRAEAAAANRVSGRCRRGESAHEHGLRPHCRYRTLRIRTEVRPFPDRSRSA